MRFPPFLPFFVAFDSKMDDPNHTGAISETEWKVHGPARHSHGKPTVRLLRGTLLFVAFVPMHWTYLLLARVDVNMKTPVAVAMFESC